MPLFDVALGYVLKLEGGYVDSPTDPGGATNLGVSLRAVQGDLRFDFDKDGRVTPGDIAQLDKHPDIYVPWYRLRYWVAAGCDSLSEPGVAIRVFDCAVNCGPRASVKMLQRACGTLQDGVIGAETLKVASQYGPRLIPRLVVTRARYYAAQPEPQRTAYLAGWMNRMERLETMLLGDAR